MEAILKIGPQTTKHGKRTLLQILNYHRAIIPAFAEINTLFDSEVKKRTSKRNVPWQKNHAETLNKIKQILTSNPILVPPKRDCE